MKICRPPSRLYLYGAACFSAARASRLASRATVWSVEQAPKGCVAEIVPIFETVLHAGVPLCRL
eukprot:scaffold590_cov75-Phaeocystis_antarctica.AAC.1